MVEPEFPLNPVRELDAAHTLPQKSATVKSVKCPAAHKSAPPNRKLAALHHVLREYGVEHERALRRQREMCSCTRMG
jgi:hypothetical protein